MDTPIKDSDSTTQASPSPKQIKKAKPIRTTCLDCETALQNLPGRGAPRKFCEPCGIRVANLQAKVAAARQRASKSGLDYTLSSSDIVAQAKAQGWKCAITKIPFEIDKQTQVHSCPWAVSLDRIDSSKGYVAGNVRLVVWSYNLLKSDWPDETAREIIERLAEAVKSQR
jgi:hypothetical protein